MKNFLDTIRRQVTEFFGKLTKKQKIIIAVSAVAVLAVIITLSLLLGRVKYEVLYTGLDESEAGKIMAVLKDKSIDAKAQGTGTILVPATDADKVRMELAAEGYPESGLNYDIFSKTSSMGKTDEEIETYEKYQLQENLRQTILMLDKIKDCVVLVNLSKDSLYVLSSDENASSASVMLDIKNGQTLTSAEAKAIGELVSKSVPGLKLENVRIVDSAMNLYDVTGDNQQEYTGTQYQLTEQMKDTLAKQVMNILKPVFGADNVSTAVNVVLNFDKETVNSVEFKPPVDGEDKGLATSVQELYEKTQGNSGATGTPGTDSNGAGTSEYLYTSDQAKDFSKISRSANYALNQTQTEIEKAQGKIQDLSVAVLINSDAYSGDYTDSVTQLVSKAIGVDASLVSVVSMPFTQDKGGSSALDEQAAILQKQNTKEVLTTVIIALTVLVALALGFKFVKSVMESHGKQLPATGKGLAVDMAVGEGETEGGENTPDITERAKSANSEQIEKFVDRDPAAVAQLLRNWLTDEDR